MRKTKALYGDEARQKMFTGVEQVYNAVCHTMGARGRNVIYKKWGMPIVTNDGISIAREILPEDDFEYLGAETIKQASEQTNADAGDGPQPLWAKIMTPDGFKTMGEIEAGDKILGTNQSTQTVLGVFDKGTRKLYRVKFSNSVVAECCEDHLWEVALLTGGKKVLTTKQIIDSGLAYYRENGKIQYKYFIPTEAVAFSEKKLPIDPYTLGVLIGDGSLSQIDTTEISLGLKKEHVLDKLVFPDGITTNVRYDENKNYFRVKIVGQTKDGLSIRDLLKEVGLLGTKSATKFIPKKYLYSSIEQREALLLGLTDTDGHINQRGLLEYSTVSEQLCLDMRHLMLSLGKEVAFYKRNRVNDEGSYSMTPIFRLTELLGRKHGRKIVEIEDTGIVTPMRCIKVSNEDNLYFTDDFVLTHNTSGTIVLAHHMLLNGRNALDAGANPMILRREMEIAKDKLVAALKEKSVPVNDLKEVAMISVEDEKLAELVSGIVNEVGVDGSVVVQESNGTEIRSESMKGYTWQQGYVSPYMITNQKGEAALEDVAIIITDKNLNLNTQLITPIRALAERNVRNIFVVAKEFDGELLQTAIANKQQGNMNIVAVKAPATPEELEDLAIVTGATAVTEEKGIKEITVEHVGHAKKIIASKDRTIVVGDEGKEDEIQVRVDEVREAIKAEDHEKYGDIEVLKARLSRLAGGIATIKVGGHTEAERAYYKMKLDDAVGACMAALAEGVVPGGGTTLRDLAEILDDEIVGERVIKHALSKPYVQILKNAGFDEDSINEGKNYNVLTGEEIDDMMAAGIVDPAKVVRCVIENATSTAKTLLTTECAIVDIPKEEKKD